MNISPYLLSLAVLGCLPASAELVTSIQSVTSSPGNTNSSFEFDVTNTGMSSVTVAAFSFHLTVPSAIIFQSASISTLVNPYIFDVADSFDNLISTPLSSSVTSTDIIGADAWVGMSSGFVLGAGSTVGLGEVYFNVDPAAALGPYTVAFTNVNTDTSFSDPGGNYIPITTASSGTISVVAPEPATVSMMAIALAGLTLAARKRRKLS
jgi:hypothetical protein